MAVPKFYELHKPLLQALQDGAIHNSKDLRADIAKALNLTEDDLSQMLSSGAATVYKDRYSWARTYLLHAGLIESPKRTFLRITLQGLDVLKENPPLIDISYLKRFPAFVAFYTPKPKTDAPEQEGLPIQVERPTQAAPQIPQPEEETETPESVIETAYATIRRGLAEEVLTEVRRLSPEAFERLILDLMGRMGYGTFRGAAKTTARSRDEGIDGIIMQDKLGFDLIYVQAKHWDDARTVGRPEVQAFVGAIAGHNGKGLFVTTASFSQQAREYADKQHIILIDGARLAELMIDHDFGVATKRSFAIKTLDSTLFEDYQA